MPLPCFAPPDLGPHRTVYAHQQIPSLEAGVSIVEVLKNCADNVVKTSKYEVWNFIPKNLFEQFRRVANFYFLCIVIVQFALLDRTPVSPMTSLLPLLFVIFVTAIKQGYEDYLRHQADKEVNECDITVIKNGEEQHLKSKDIKVGDVVLVKNDEEFPCDMIVLTSNLPDGVCHIMTANLDGETNLKTRCSLLETEGLRQLDALSSFQSKIECDHPEYDMYKYNGRMTLYNGGSPSTHALGPTNLLLRGSKLKNTEYCYGLAVYTGKETKMALNQKEKVYKFSSIERSMNKYLIFFLIILVIMSFLCTALKIMFEKNNDFWYLLKPYELDALEFIVDLCSFLILFNYIIPISLYVTVELQKFCGARFFNWDLELYHAETDEPAKANTSDLMEELGQIEYVFSDKTGTLTENDMQFRQCSIGGVKYVDMNNRLSLEGSFDSQKDSTFTNEVKEFLLALALCHTVQADEKSQVGDNVDGVDGGIQEQRETTVYTYQASSPDEKALCEASAKFGVTFKGKNGDYLELDVKGELERYKLLHVLEFDSTRKRMSVILETPTGEILLLCKGAESHVLPRCTQGPADDTLEHIDGYAELGLRTLAIVSKKIDNSLYVELDKKLVKAQQAINDREQQLAEIFEEIEQNFTLLGATAVEDKLQDGVKETIESLREAGVKVWVLTGDKLETALNISHSCGHFKSDMEILSITQKQNEGEIKRMIEEYKQIVENEESVTEKVMVVDGASLARIMQYFVGDFLEIAEKCVAVLCCRMSPLQKAQIVKMVKNGDSKPTTLAIGDGANDCSMIQEAHVGCGIMGKEGRQAVRCSDYAFHRFRYLKRVLLVHGHYFYTRLAIVVQYFFYKNVAFILPQLLFQFWNGYSAQPVYASVFLTCFNIFFTSLPILFYGIFEQDLKSETLMDNPMLYRDQANNDKLSWRQFGYWTFSGIWHGVIVFIGIRLLYTNPPFSSDMLDHGLFSFGTFAYTLIIVITNLKLATIMHFWTWFMHLFLWGSIAIYFIFALILCAFLWPWPFLRDWFNLPLDLDLYYVIYSLFDSSIFWFSSLFIIVVALIPDIIGPVFCKYFIPTKTQQCQWKERKRSSHHCFKCYQTFDLWRDEILI